MIAVRDDYRQQLRDNAALEILLTQLRSPSLAVVGNACGALWNISARSSADQKTLISLGAVSLLKNLVSSKHRLISMGSSATIKNLTAFKQDGTPLSCPISLPQLPQSVPHCTTFYCFLFDSPPENIQPASIISKSCIVHLPV